MKVKEIYYNYCEPINELSVMIITTERKAKCIATLNISDHDFDEEEDKDYAQNLAEEVANELGYELGE